MSIFIKKISLTFITHVDIFYFLICNTAVKLNYKKKEISEFAFDCMLELYVLFHKVMIGKLIF